MLRWLILFTKIALSAGLVWYAFSKIDVASAMDYLRGMSGFAVAVVLALLFAQMVLAGLRLRALLAQFGARCDVIHAVDVVMVGAFFSQTMISFIGGDAMRIWRIVRSSTSIGVATRSILFDRAAGFVGLILLALLGLPFLLQLVKTPELRLGLLVSMAAFVAGLFFFLSLKHIPVTLRKWRILRLVADLSADARRLARDRMGALTILGLSVSIQVMNVVILYVIARFLSMEISFFNALILLPPVLFMSMLPISVAGWGVREGAMVVALKMIEIPAHQSLALSICFGLCALAVSLPGGALWFYTRKQAADRTPNGDAPLPKRD
jgi:uncharacterized membrane protein YbhN (UPF0104 family)